MFINVRRHCLNQSIRIKHQKELSGIQWWFHSCGSAFIATTWVAHFGLLQWVESQLHFFSTDGFWCKWWPFSPGSRAFWWRGRRWESGAWRLVWWAHEVQASKEADQGERVHDTLGCKGSNWDSQCQSHESQLCCSGVCRSLALPTASLPQDGASWPSEERGLTWNSFWSFLNSGGKMSNDVVASVYNHVFTWYSHPYPWSIMIWPLLQVPCQVKAFRAELDMKPNPAHLQCDSQGLKKLFSHGIRRFCDSKGNITAREAYTCLQ